MKYLYTNDYIVVSMCAQEIRKETIISEIEHIPEQFYGEILDFVLFLRTKTLKEKLSTAVASESALKKDWLRNEEDEAWRDL